jgi:predicted dehydrogenase
MRIAIVGCGYVADMYMQTLPGFDNLTLLGAFDRDPHRLEAFSRFHRIRTYPSLEALLGDERVQLVVNLTNPRSHYEISLTALESGRHVYSEKPLGMTMAEAETLVNVAKERGLGLAAAPCNHLSDVVQSLRRELAAGRLGKVVLAQAEMDDGWVAALAPETWRSISGAPWPIKDEYEVGCTLEHAGYQIGPLVALFGSVRRVTAFSACLLPEKGISAGARIAAPDFSVGVLEFDGGVIARLTNSIVAPVDRSLRVVGERGVATIPDVWEYHAPLRLSTTGMQLGARMARKLEKRLSGILPRVMLGRSLPVRHDRWVPRTQGGHRMDFSRGIAQLAAQVEQGAPALVGPKLALHVTEVTLALQSGTANGAAAPMRTAVD